MEASPDISVSPREVGTSTLDLALRIVEFLAHRREPAPLADIAGAFGASKATVYRHLATLQRHGFVRQDARNGRYGAGVKLLVLGEAVRGRFDVISTAKPSLVRLRDETGQAASLCALIDDEVVVLDLVEGRAIIDFGTRPGTRFDFHASAHGKIWLAFGPHDLAARVFATPLKEWTDATLTTVPALRRQVERVRASGWAIAPGEVMPGVNALAAPVFDHRGQLVASAAIVGSTQVIPSPPDPRQVEAVVACAAAISADCGWKRNA